MDCSPGLLSVCSKLLLFFSKQAFACLEDVVGVHIAGNAVKEALSEVFLNIRSDYEDNFAISVLLCVVAAVVKKGFSVGSDGIDLLDSTVS